MVYAKTVSAYKELLRQFKERETTKQYLALLFGKMKDSRVIQSYLTRDPKNRLLFTSIPEDSKILADLKDNEEAKGGPTNGPTLRSHQSKLWRLHHLSLGRNQNRPNPPDSRSCKEHWVSSGRRSPLYGLQQFTNTSKLGRGTLRSSRPKGSKCFTRTRSVLRIQKLEFLSFKAKLRRDFEATLEKIAPYED